MKKLFNQENRLITLSIGMAIVLFSITTIFSLTQESEKRIIFVSGIVEAIFILISGLAVHFAKKKARAEIIVAIVFVIVTVVAMILLPSTEKPMVMIPSITLPLWIFAISIPEISKVK